VFRAADDDGVGAGAAPAAAVPQFGDAASLYSRFAADSAAARRLVEQQLFDLQVQLTVLDDDAKLAEATAADPRAAAEQVADIALDRRYVMEASDELEAMLRLPIGDVPLDVPTYEESAAAATQDPAAELYDVYRSTDGQQVFLHPLSVKIVRDNSTRTGQPMPPTLTVRVVDTEVVTQTAATRAALRQSAHVPLHATLQMVFADTRGAALPEVAALFDDAVKGRLRKLHEHRERGDRDSREIEQRVRQRHDARMAAARAERADWAGGAAQCSVAEVQPSELHSAFVELPDDAAAAAADGGTSPPQRPSIGSWTAAPAALAHGHKADIKAAPAHRDASCPWGARTSEDGGSANAAMTSEDSGEGRTSSTDAMTAGSFDSGSQGGSAPQSRRSRAPRSKPATASGFTGFM
jgi:hypothetical protein